jgi:Integrase core domain
MSIRLSIARRSAASSGATRGSVSRRNMTAPGSGSFGYERLNQQSAIRFLDYVLEKLPFKVEVIQTDHGAEFGSQFHYHVLDRGIGHVYIKPATPRLNGKVERSHRIDQEDFYRMLEGVVIDDTSVFNDKLQEWEDFYNFNRPHGALGGQTPYERLPEKTRARA